MQTPSLRYIVLIAILLIGAGIYAGLGEPRGIGTPRWPAADSVYAVDGWSVGPEVDAQGGFKSRAFHDAGGHTVMMSLFSNQAPKLYAAGAEVPFLGNGYSVAPAPTDLLPPLASGTGALVARKGSEQWLVLYAYGERRGLLGNGLRAWTFAVFDGVMGRPNDYYKVFLATRADPLTAGLGHAVGALASELFPRIAGFYAG